MKKIKKPISVLLSLMMVVSLFTIVPITANADVTQIWLKDLLDKNPDAQTLSVTGEVYVDRNITLDKTLKMTGDTELIVEAGCTLTLSVDRMFVYGGYHDLTISGAGTITGKMSTGIQIIKELVVNVGRLDLFHCNSAGMQANSITINGGNITVRGMNPMKAKTDINLNGGVIDCLNYQAGGHIYVNGFEVQASDIGGQVLNIDTSNADYTIRWKNADGSTLKTDYLKYGQTPSYSGATPTKTGDAQYSYNFSGWSPKILIVTENMTYTAQFSRTVNSYTVTWEDDDGTTLATDTVEYGKTPYYRGTTPTKASEGEYIYTFRDWTPSVSTVSGNVTYTAEYTKSRIADHFSQSGDTCTIHDALGWDIFCDLLAENNKGYFDGKTVLLDDDISVTRMAGGSYHDFTGTFDGQGHTLTVAYGTFDEPVSNDDKTAPFRNAESGCVIKNLRTAGTIYTSKKYAGGFIGTQYGTVRLENCRSSVTINSLTAGDGTHGGFVGNNGNGSDLTIDGCVFDGKILSAGETATTSCSGFVGYKHNNGTVTITNSIYVPAALDEGETWVSSDHSAAFARNGADIANSYYTVDFNDGTNYTAQGKAARTITAGQDVSVALGGEATEYDVSGITAYADNSGLLYGDTIYAGNEDNAALTLGYTGTPSEGYQFSGYAASAGTLDGTENHYTLTMPDEDVTVSAVFEFSDGVGARLAGHSISLQGDIGVNFYMELAPEIAQSQTAYMLFTIPNGDNPYTAKVYVNEQSDATLPHAVKNGNYYVFKCNVAAKEMTSIIKARIYDGDTVGDEYTYSVKEYADYLLDHTGDNTEYAKAAPLVRAMLRYGAYAKEFFDKTNTLDPLDDVNITIDDPVIGEFPEGTTFDGATLSLKSKTTLSLYLTSNVQGLTFTCAEISADGQPVREMTVENVKTETGYIARIRDIAASELKNNFTLTVKNGETVLGTITYSPMNYCYKALHGGTTDERLINAVKALVAYADAAKVYFG